MQAGPMTTVQFDVEAARARFGSLRSQDFAFFDAPGGSQVPDEVGFAMSRTLREASANLGAPYRTSRRVEEILERAKDDAGRFLGGDGDNIVFGANMTSLNFMLTRTATRAFAPGDEILVTRLDHDANVAPWLEVAEDRGLTVRLVDVTGDFELDYDDLERSISSRTRVVAFPWAANSFGTRVDAARVCRLAREAGALSWVDAVHYAAHEPIDAIALGADVVLCSPYKFCGPHLGMAHLRPEVAEQWRPYKVRPTSSRPLGRRFETGTPPYELLAGLSATIAYLESLGGMEVIATYERALMRRFWDALPEGVTVYGAPLEGRVPTFLLNVEGVPAVEVAHALAAQRMGVWHHDHYYAVGLADRLPYEDEAVRLGFLHYNTAGEIDRLAAALGALVR
jgi:cysteine desulfurase family protein (TIGR01976 family)